ncbi:hypothetical protein GGR54DRAFT_623581 [Hypoxylon sp. NC1633]|nr:hypothetical protein GGR54DRAFT_623581 [Hypoxylon sp. NC1633]
MSRRPGVNFSDNPEFRNAMVEDDVETPDYYYDPKSDDDDDDDDVPRSSGRREPPQEPRAQKHTSNRPKVGSPHLIPVSQRKTTIDQTPTHHSPPPPPPARRPIGARRTSYFDQPVTHNDGFPEQTRESSRGPSVRPRVSVPERTSRSPYPTINVNYEARPMMSPLSPPQQHWNSGYDNWFYERPEYYAQRGSAYSRYENDPEYRPRPGFDDEGLHEPMMTPALARGPRPGMGDIQYGMGDIDAVQDEERVGFEHMTAKKRDQEITKITEEMIKGIKAENRAAAKAREAEAMRNEESAKLIQAKMVQSIDEIVVLLKDKIHQELRTEKQANRRNQAKRDQADQTQAEVQGGVEESAAHPGDHSESPDPGMNPPPSLQLSVDNKSLPKQPPDVPDPPDAYAETGNESQTMDFSSRQMRRLWRLEQEERSRERKERKSIRMIWEELGFPIAETLAAGLAGAAYGYAPPMPAKSRSFHQHYSPRPSRASDSRLHSTYRRFSSSPGSIYSESEVGDATHSPRRYGQDRKRPRPRGRSPLRRRVEMLQHGAELSSQHGFSAEWREEPGTSTRNDNDTLVEAEPRPAEITAKAALENGEENIEENVEGLTENDPNDAVGVRFWFDFALMEITARLMNALEGLMS